MNELQFSYTSLAYQVHFGQGQSKLVDRLIPDGEKVFVIAEERNKHLSEALAAKIGRDNVTLFSEITQHVPVALVDRATAAYKTSGSSWILSIGGGSTIGLGKAIALREDTSLIAIPTTYAGSEMTNIYGITGEDGTKTTGRDNRVMAKHIIYDPELTISLPTKLAVTSAINALAHLVEAAYSPNINPVTYQNAVYGIRQLIIACHILSKEKKLSVNSNKLFLEAAFLAGKVLCEVPMSLHHKAAHVLGGNYNLEHSHVHTVMLPFVLEYQWIALSNKVKEDLKKYMMHPYPPQAIMDIIRLMDAPFSLKSIGYKQENIADTVFMMLKNPYANARPLEAEGLTQLLEKAYEGKLIGTSINA